LAVRLVRRVDREWVQAVVSTSFLPECIEKSTIILPRDSDSGRYLISVTHDRTGNDLLAHGSATAICTGDRKEVSIDLDLRNSQLGSYFLSTTYEQDQAFYYYPWYRSLEISHSAGWMSLESRFG
jgi:hypothetical protein